MLQCFDHSLPTQHFETVVRAAQVGNFELCSNLFTEVKYVKLLMGDKAPR